MTKEDYFRRANEITEWQRLGIITDQEAERRQFFLESERRHAVERDRIGRIQFQSAGATRKR